MSNFCTKCGATVTPDSTFCPTCGTPIPASAAIPQPPPVAPYVTPPASAAPQPVYVPVPVQPVPVQTTSGGGALKIILIVIGVFVFLGVIGASIVGFIGWRVARAVHVDKNGGGLSIDTPKGTISAGGDSSIGSAQLGVDIYPGATRGQGSLNLSTPEGSMVTAVFTTEDSASQVVDFYKSKLGDNVATSETGSGTMITTTDSEASSKIMITVTPEGNKTKIAIVHTATKKN